MRDELRDALVAMGWHEEIEDGEPILLSPNRIVGLDPGKLCEKYLRSFLPSLKRRVETSESAKHAGRPPPYSADAMADVQQLIAFVEEQLEAGR